MSRRPTTQLKMPFTWENILNRQMSESARIAKENRRLKSALRTDPRYLEVVCVSPKPNQGTK
jgi:hypothetical protein